MALPLGKLTILVGAGLVGSVLAKEGRLPGAYDLFSGAYRIFLNPLKQDDSIKLSSKPKYDMIMQQVDSLREELSLLTPNRAITIVTGSQSGSGKYGITVIVIIVGSGYVWWKGWRLSDMMFATRRSLSDARDSIAKSLENVYSSISDTRRHLSSKIQHVDCKIDECMENTTATKSEVSAVRGGVQQMGEKFKNFQSDILSLENRVNKFEEKQEVTMVGVNKLLIAAADFQNSASKQPIEGSGSRPALESSKGSASRPAPVLIFPTRTASLPLNTSPEPPSPTTNGFYKKNASFSSSSSSQSTFASRWKELPGTSEGLGIANELPGTSEGLEIASTSTPQVSDVTHASEDTNNEDTPEVSNVNHASEDTNNGNSFTTVIGRTFSGFSFFRRKQ